MRWRWGRGGSAVEAEVIRLRTELRRTRRLAELSERSPHAMVVHCGGVVRWANREAASLVGLADPAQSIGRDLYEFIDPRSSVSTRDRIGRLLEGGGVLQTAEAYLLTQAGDTIVVETRAALTEWDGDPAVHVVIWDVTERHRSSAMLEWEASHDPLTGIWNRRAVLRHLEGLLAAGGAAEIAVALVDLNGFKSVNDGLGHQTGDQVLADVARRLCRVPGSDAVGRLGGDEFLLVCPDGAGAAREMAGWIESELRLRRVGGIELPAPVTATVGVASAPPCEATVEHLLAAADADLYTRRRAGRRSPRG